MKADRVFSYWKELSPFNMLFKMTQGDGVGGSFFYLRKVLTR